MAGWNSLFDNPITSGLGINPAQGANTAAGGAKKASGQYGDLAQQQQQFQLQGLDRSLAQYQGLAGQYQQPGALEQYYQNTMNGADPYFNRVMQQGQGAINSQMAARGGLNSGAALAAQGNFTSGLEAQMYQNRGQMAQAAEAAQLGRLGGLSGLAGQQAGLIQSAYGLGGQMYGNEMGNSINALNQGAQFRGQGQNAGVQMVYDLGKAALGSPGSSGGKG